MIIQYASSFLALAHQMAALKMLLKANGKINKMGVGMSSVRVF